jgi:hypothetical protein
MADKPPVNFYRQVRKRMKESVSLEKVRCSAPFLKKKQKAVTPFLTPFFDFSACGRSD